VNNCAVRSRHGYGCIPIDASMITGAPQITIVTSADR
jgi:hypothetical protein